MALSKETRLLVLLAIDTIFFLLELIVGSYVHSLALIADAFHMLNDVLSLCVGLWAVRVANSSDKKEIYTYGWRRAETLGALLNGVFLVALCVSIFLEAIQRFVEPPVITHPDIILYVGCAGLASNIIGLLLFGHGHDHGDPVKDAEEGHSHAHEHEHEHETSKNFFVTLWSKLPAPFKTSTVKTKHTRSASSIEDMPEFPSSMRRDLIDSSRRAETHEHTESEPLIANGHQHYGTREHNHAKPKVKAGGHGHSHGDLNMRGVFLHVMGDALGNIGVIATAVFIWKTDYSWRFYADPMISLLITGIILASAIPLCKATSRILLQAVPEGISFESIQAKIEHVVGTGKCHDLHVWQLSDTEYIASLHIIVSKELMNKDAEGYMKLVAEVKDLLHKEGVHKTTIQPEVEPSQGLAVNGDGPSKPASKAGSVREQEACLLECDTNCKPVVSDAHDHDHAH